MNTAFTFGLTNAPNLQPLPAEKVSGITPSNAAWWAASREAHITALIVLDAPMGLVMVQASANTAERSEIARYAEYARLHGAYFLFVPEEGDGSIDVTSKPPARPLYPRANLY